MKIIINLIITIVFTWPFLLIGYVYNAIETGFMAGKYLNSKHSDSAILFFKSKTK